MAAEGDDVNIRFGASIDDLKDKLGQVGELFKGIAEGASQELAGRAAGAFKVFGKDAETVATSVIEKWQSIGPVMQAVAGVVLAAGAIIGGGLAAKKYADENKEMVDETRDLARALGITTNEASVMRAVLDDVGATQGEYTGAAKGLSNQLRSNEEGMKRMGLVTRDANGELRPLNKLTLDAIDLLGTYKEGTDRAMASRELFGRGVDASSRLMLINSKAIEENRNAVEELNLMVGEASVAGRNDYDAATHRASLTTQALGKAIAESVLPVVTELTEWFNNLAPAAITVFRGALGGLSTVFLGLTNGVRIVWEVINAMVISVAEPIRALAVSIGKAITGDFKGAGAEIMGIGKTIGDAWGTAFDKISESSQKTSDRIGRIWAFGTGGDAAPGDSGVGKGTETYKGKPPKPAKEKKAGPTGEYAVERAEYAYEKADAEASLAVLNEYLKSDKALNEEAYRDNLVSIADYFAKKLEIELQGNRQSLDAKRDELREAEEAERKARERMATAKTPQEANKFEAQAIKATTEQVKLLGHINVLEAQQGELIRRNGVEREDAERKLANELASIAAGSTRAGSEGGIAQERAQLQQMKALRQISADDAFAIERAFEQRSYAATQTFQAAKRALIIGDDKRAKAQADADEEAAERQHQERMTQIEMRAEIERKKYSIEAQQSIQGAFSTMVGSILNGVTKIGDVFRNFARSVTETFVNLIAKKFTEKLFDATGANKLIDKMVSFLVDGVGQMVTAFVGGEATKTAAATAGATTRQAVDVESALVSKATTGESAIANIGAKAWEAAANVYSSIAAIPVVGPFLAPAAAIAAGAVVLGFIGRIASSEGGEYQVDQDRLNFVHKDETILPAPFASGLRALVGEGGQSPLSLGIGQILQSIGSGGAPRAGQSWRLPDVSSPHASITPAAESAASGRSGAGARPLYTLPPGMSSRNFYMTTGRDLLKFLNGAGRDFRKGSL